MPLPVLGTTAGTLGCLQALEAIKHVTGLGACARNRIVFWDGESLGFEEVKIVKNPDCPVCGSTHRAT